MISTLHSLLLLKKKKEKKGKERGGMENKRGGGNKVLYFMTLAFSLRIVNPGINMCHKHRNGCSQEQVKVSY